MAATLPKTPFQLHGGCFCTAIRYTISVPTLEERKALPKIPAYLERPRFVPINEVNERLPIISLDHCGSCRRISGAIVESWFICPPSWVEFTLQPRESGDEKEKEAIKAEGLAYLQEDQTLAQRTWVTHFKSSEHANRTFCGKCGTHLTFFKTDTMSPLRQMLGQFFDIAVGSLDKESVEMEGFGPSAQVWDKDGISWVVKLVNEGKKSLLADVSDEMSKLKVEDEEKK